MAQRGRADIFVGKAEKIACRRDFARPCAGREIQGKMQRKSCALKRLEGTWRKDRDAEAERRDAALAERRIIYPPDARVPCPRSIRSRAARAYWREMAGMLCRLQVLSPADLPQLEELCLVLEKMREAWALLQGLSPSSDGFARLLPLCMKLSKRFDELGSKYYVSPAARSRLALDAIAASQAARESRAEADAIASVLASRK